MELMGNKVVMNAKELNAILEFAVENGCTNCEFHPNCYFASECITNDFKFYIDNAETIARKKKLEEEILEKCRK